MFLLHEIADTLRVEPSKMHGSKEDTLATLIEKKYGNKIVCNVGYVVGLHSIRSIGDSYIHPGDGGLFTDVTFDLIIFRPFEGEAIEGVVAACRASYIRVSINSFQDIFISPIDLRQPCTFDAETSFWECKLAGDQVEEEEEEGCGFFITKGQKIRVCVQSVEFRDPKDSKNNGDSITRNRSESVSSVVAEDMSTPKSMFKSAMVVTATIKDDGFGPVEWWEADEEQPQE